MNRAFLSKGGVRFKAITITLTHQQLINKYTLSWISLSVQLISTPVELGFTLFGSHQHILEP